MKDLTRRTLIASRILLILLFFNMLRLRVSRSVEKQTFLRTLSAEAMSDVDGKGTD